MASNEQRTSYSLRKRKAVSYRHSGTEKIAKKSPEKTDTLKRLPAEVLVNILSFFRGRFIHKTLNEVNHKFSSLIFLHLANGPPYVVLKSVEIDLRKYRCVRFQGKWRKVTHNYSVLERNLPATIPGYLSVALVKFRGERENWRMDANEREARVLSALRKIWDGRETIFKVEAVRSAQMLQNFLALGDVPFLELENSFAAEQMLRNFVALGDIRYLELGNNFGFVGLNRLAQSLKIPTIRCCMNVKFIRLYDYFKAIRLDEVDEEVAGIVEWLHAEPDARFAHIRLQSSCRRSLTIGGTSHFTDDEANGFPSALVAALKKRFLSDEKRRAYEFHLDAWCGVDERIDQIFQNGATGEILEICRQKFVFKVTRNTLPYICDEKVKMAKKK